MAKRRALEDANDLERGFPNLTYMTANSINAKSTGLDELRFGKISVKNQRTGALVDRDPFPLYSLSVTKPDPYLSCGDPYRGGEHQGVPGPQRDIRSGEGATRDNAAAHYRPNYPQHAFTGAHAAFNHDRHQPRHSMTKGLLSSKKA